MEIRTELQLTPTSKRAEIPIYSFSKHQRMENTTTIYSPHVIILEGIFALHDPRIIDLLDMRVNMFSSDLDYRLLTAV